MIKTLKKIYSFVFPSINYYLKRELEGCKSVLDLGCGADSFLEICDGIDYAVGVELFEEDIVKSKTKGIHTVYVQEDITKIEFSPKSFDAVILIDVIEHLKKEEGIKMFEKMECWARKKVIVVTPNGFVPQKEEGGNYLQNHLSGWATGEFKQRGYSVFGLHGLKFLRGEHAELKYKPFYLWLIISNATQKFVYHFPSLAYHLLVVKKPS